MMLVTHPISLGYQPGSTVPECLGSPNDTKLPVKLLASEFEKHPNLRILPYSWDPGSPNLRMVVMKPKGPMRFVSAIIDPLLIIWRSVIGSLGIDAICHIISWEISLNNSRNPAPPRDKSYLSIFRGPIFSCNKVIVVDPIDNHCFLLPPIGRIGFGWFWNFFPSIVSKLLVGQLHPQSLTTRPWKMVVGRLPCKFLHLWLMNSFMC